MKTIGMIGGSSWKSSTEYYRIVNEAVSERLGGHHSCQCLMFSIDFDGFSRMQHEARWDEAADVFIDAARRLEKGGADFFIMCANTPHKMAEQVQNSVSIPLLHIADVTGEAIRESGLSRVGLLGTKFTMEQDFIKGRLSDKFGIEAIVPDERDRDSVHRVLYDELCLGIINEESRKLYVEIIDRLKGSGAEGVILGCTEIPLLIRQEHVSIPVFDTTEIHALAAVDYALSQV